MLMNLILKKSHELDNSKASKDSHIPVKIIKDNQLKEVDPTLDEGSQYYISIYKRWSNR